MDLLHFDLTFQSLQPVEIQDGTERGREREIERVEKREEMIGWQMDREREAFMYIKLNTIILYYILLQMYSDIDASTTSCQLCICKSNYLQLPCSLISEFLFFYFEHLPSLVLCFHEQPLLSVPRLLLLLTLLSHPLQLQGTLPAQTVGDLCSHEEDEIN